MSLSHLEVSNLRNISQAGFDPGPAINLIVGPNASGKTSLLEAIYLIGRGRSFRASQHKRVIRNDCDSLYVFGRVEEGSAGRSIGISIENGGQFKAKVDGKFLKKSSELATALPLLFISPNADRLVSGSPRQRRRFIDLGMFHVEHNFLSVWQRYNRVLLQRNGALRGQNRAIVSTWTEQLLGLAEALHNYRSQYIDELVEVAGQYIQALTGLDSVSFRYQQGWPQDQSYPEALAAIEERDFSAGFTQRGPHRADLKILLDKRPAEQYLSGGQQKLVAAALVLAQATLYKRHLNKSCLMLVDDLPAELDTERRRAFMKLLVDLDGQAFITATDESLIDLSSLAESRVFHVKNGEVSGLKE